MKRFQFRLARVRDLRKQQLEVEEARLQTLLSERAALEAELARIHAEAAGTRAGMRSGESSVELVAGDRYLTYLTRRQIEQERKLLDRGQRAVRQRGAVIELRRKLRLLESLEAKRRAEWNAEADREQERLSAELYLARWKS